MDTAVLLCRKNISFDLYEPYDEKYWPIHNIHISNLTVGRCSNSDDIQALQI